MKRSAGTIKNKLKHIYSTIQFFETVEEASSRYKDKNIIIFTYTIPTGEERILKYFSLEHLEEEHKENEKNLIFDEYRIVSRFAEHDNVVRVYEANELYENNEVIGVYYTMERFSATLKDVMNEQRSFTDEEIWNFLAQMDSVLQVSHYQLEKPFIHSDIKPANIGIRYTRKGIMFVLMDFDVSVDLERNSDGESFSLSNRAMMKGFTPGYASPEQVLANLHGEGNISNRVDVYAIGVIALEMITGISPKKNPDSLYYDLPLDMIPERWRDIINPLIHHDPKKRVKTIAEALYGSSSMQESAYQRNNTTSIPKSYNANAQYSPATVSSSSGNRTRNALLYSLTGVLFFLIIVLLYQQDIMGNLFSGIVNKGVDSNIEMVPVDGGCFMMGCDDCGASASPGHEVCVDDFYIGKYEVTQKQWKKVMGYNPAYFQGNENDPVENVSWKEVQEFIRKLNNQTGERYRLPTEAEWEYAAGGGKHNNNFRFAGSNNINNVGWYKENSSNQTRNVGEKKPNALGIYDMTGNVWEWCLDLYDPGYYEESPKKDPCNKKNGVERVIRGGSMSSNAGNCRNKKRGKDFPGNSSRNIGFRLVKIE